MSLSFSNIVTAWETMVFVVVTVILVPATLRWHYWRFGAKAFVWSMGVSAGLITLRLRLRQGPSRQRPRWPWTWACACWRRSSSRS